MSIIYEEYLTSEEREERINQCNEARRELISNFLIESATKKEEISVLEAEVKLLTENGTYDDYESLMSAISEDTQSFFNEHTEIFTEISKARLALGLFNTAHTIKGDSVNRLNSNMDYTFAKNITIPNNVISKMRNVFDGIDPIQKIWKNLSTADKTKVPNIGDANVKKLESIVDNIKADNFGHSDEVPFYKKTFDDFVRGSDQIHNMMESIDKILNNLKPEWKKLKIPYEIQWEQINRYETLKNTFKSEFESVRSTIVQKYNSVAQKNSDEIQSYHDDKVCKISFAKGSDSSAELPDSFEIKRGAKLKLPSMKDTSTNKFKGWSVDGQNVLATFDTKQPALKLTAVWEPKNTP